MQVEYRYKRNLPPDELVGSAPGAAEAVRAKLEVYSRTGGGVTPVRPVCSPVAPHPEKLQGDPSGCSPGFVDLKADKAKVAYREHIYTTTQLLF